MPHIRYTGGLIDRDGNRRADAEYVSALQADGLSRVVPVWRDKNLIAPETPAGVLLNGDAGAGVLEQAGQVVYLGKLDGQAVFGADLSDMDEGKALSLAESGAFTDLRAVGPLLETQDAITMAYARGMLYWHRQQRFCGACGSPTESRQSGHARRCTGEACGREFHPRTDPAVIMLVVTAGRNGRPPRCLLGNNTKMPAGVYSTLAGFVEPGESLEEAVVREVEEEAGVTVSDVVYMGSQPWPFPASIMLGFRATAVTTDIRFDPEELTDARWFTADEVRDFGEWADTDIAYRRPRKDSIARSLLDAWLADVDA